LEKDDRQVAFLGNRHFEVLIDIGCGTGSFLEKAGAIYDYAIGIDLSAKMLQIATKRKTANADYVLASSSSLPLKTASSDCTVSISTSKAGSNLSSFIADLKRISRENSLLAFTLFQQPGLPNPESLAKPVQSTIISDRETLYFLRPADSLE